MVFRLNDRLCALYLEQVLQVVHAVDAMPLPQAPDIVLGAIDLHGEIVPLLNIRRRFGFSDRDVRVEDQFIIAKTTNRVVALAVDEVLEIVERSADRIIPAENIVGRLEHVDGVIQLEDGLALIHDLDKFLSLGERHELEARPCGGRRAMSDDVLAAELPRLSDFIADAIGLDFPPSRWNDLQRGLAATSKELGFATPEECARRFLAGPVAKGQIETLATHLTVGETYFMREGKSFELLAEKIIPAMVRRRRDGDRRLRIWSAACCTGEEAYSIAIVLHQAIPDIADWNITLLATDINSRFLCKAAAGIYGQWSFRQVPAGFRERFFRPVGEQLWEILPQIKRMVRFAPLNLVEDVYPALANETNAMDVIFCRNVLMYFTPHQARKVIENLHRAKSTTAG